METGNVNDNNQESKKSPVVTNEDLLAKLNQAMDRIAQFEAAQKNPAIQDANKQMISNAGWTGDDVMKLITQINQKNKEIDYETGILEEQIPADDYDEKGVRFTCPAVGYVLVDDVRKGMRIVLPYNKKHILFKHAGTRKIESGKHKVLFPFSVYRSHSKKEIEYIRNHTMYGTLIYESSGAAATVDAKKMARAAVIINQLKQYEHPDLIKLCRDYQVPVNDDPGVMRMQITLSMVEKEFAQESLRSNASLIQNEENAKLVPHLFSK